MWVWVLNPYYLGNHTKVIWHRKLGERVSLMFLVSWVAHDFLALAHFLCTKTLLKTFMNKTEEWWQRHGFSKKRREEIKNSCFHWGQEGDYFIRSTGRPSQYKQLFSLKAPCGQLLQHRRSWDGALSLPGPRDRDWHGLTCLSHSFRIPQHPSKDAPRTHSTPASTQHHSAPNPVNNVNLKEMRKR